MRSGPWKLCATSGKSELYDLYEDVGEQHDLAAKHPDLVEELERAWREWQSEVDATAERFRTADR